MSHQGWGWFVFDLSGGAFTDQKVSTTAMEKENMTANAAGGRALSAGELKMMLGQCLKMASENKITPHNTWGLPLIEHLDDLIKEEDPAQHTNFQRASVTLDAGVKIYSYRVDSVHTETFKILGGLGRASGPGDDQFGKFVHVCCFASLFACLPPPLSSSPGMLCLNLPLLHCREC